MEYPQPPYDIGYKILERLNCKDVASPGDKIIYFIGFRIMIYCDEMHDFGNLMAKTQLSEFKSKQCIDDISWFIAACGQQAEVYNILQQFLKRVELPTLTYAEIAKSVNPFLKALISIESDMFQADQVRKGKPKSSGRKGKEFDYISSNHDEIAKNISALVLTKIFGLEKSHFLELYGCTLRGTNFQNWINVFYHITHDRIEDKLLPLAINIDQEGSTKNSIEVYNEVIRQNNLKDCNWECKLGGSAGIIRYFTTNATIMDPGEGSFEQLRQMISDSGSRKNYSNSPPLNTPIIINFCTIPILAYQYIGGSNGVDADDKTKLQFTQIFSDYRTLQPLLKNQYSVSNIKIVLNKDINNHIYTFYKTFGDANQTITFAEIETFFIQNNIIPLFMTGDINCGMISALFSKNVITENRGVIGDGLITYLTKDEIQKTKKYLQDKDLNLTFLADYAAIRENLPIPPMLQSSPSLIQGAKDFQSIYPPQRFGISKNTKSKNTKSKNIKKKNSEKIIKLAKKYRIKLDKNVVKNIKQLLSLQKKAKKLKLHITKKNSKGKRVYKTYKELLRELKVKKITAKKTTTKKTAKRY